uniref:Immunoglobulin V-set domain-containing protein n=1 Tax=Pseudonaja textilis TaxID=8673 RepID=A0A670ZWM5_PSETE
SALLSPLVLLFPRLAMHSSWSVTYPDTLSAVQGSCAVLPCTFTFPSGVSDADGIVAIWFKDMDKQPITVFHSKSPETIDARFQSRAELLGDPLKRNCTLLLGGIQPLRAGSRTERGIHVPSVPIIPCRHRDKMDEKWCYAFNSCNVWKSSHLKACWLGDSGS